ncbi:MAG: quinate 5-dehydrogenase [Bacillota bacterium]|nr:quinate 5-dehydrogenase [Bacillota bacterium]
MKKVVSVSLGSSKRDHQVEIELLGEMISIKRIGTDGDIDKAIAMIKELDGHVDAFGMGGIDLYIYAGNKRYTLKDAVKIANAAKKTPIVDGSGLKNTLERKVIKYLHNTGLIDFKGSKVLMVSAVDRFGMAETVVALGSEATFGDLIFGLGIPIPLKSLDTLEKVASIIVPVISRLPFKLLYPTGAKQDVRITKFERYYLAADIIAGDFHFIKKHLPQRLEGKIIITNTVTQDDLKILSAAGVKTLITTTPDLNGRSFGTNVMEGVLVSLADKSVDKLTVTDYEALIDKLALRPRILDLQAMTTAN